MSLKIPKKRLPFLHKQYVAWGEMDAFLHLNHVVFAKYFENARVELLRELDLWNIDAQNKEGPIITNLQIRYIKQVRYTDLLDVTLGILNITNRSFTIGCTMWNQKEELVIVAYGDFLWFDFTTQKIVSLPQNLKFKFVKYKI
ncbi:MAG: acyl-CoA thioesterase [Leptonema sp. (in: bacteria)]